MKAVIEDEDYPVCLASMQGNVGTGVEFSGVQNCPNPNKIRTELLMLHSDMVASRTSGTIIHSRCANCERGLFKKKTKKT